MIEPQTTSREKELENALMKIAKEDWYWQGGGSDVRFPGRFGILARKVLGLPEMPRLGWPTGDRL